MVTIDEIMAVCISRQIKDEDIVAQGIATPLVAAGYLLAKLTHAPNLVFMSAIGQSLCYDWAPIGIATIENLWIAKGLMSFDFVTVACDLLPNFRPMEFFRPGQVDAYGNFNNVFIGKSATRPRLRLPGSGGIPDVTVTGSENYLYVPRHGRHTFVPKLDFMSGLGHHRNRTTGSGPKYLVTDFAQFDFGGEKGRMRLLSMHPGITMRRLLAKTGFDFEVVPDFGETILPSSEELHLLRNEIDPMGVRAIETLRGSKRRNRIREILDLEGRQLEGLG